ncbi:S49 family peptidase [Pseudobacteriovorax antillogorgiicola]|uniref:Serine protease, ClpP class n=1 Tax=Pseudobacteriovorax antillogorgiicola TaxID=1513793 RepID=A0A1Y6CPY6_9BACT|nr:S49 family peptidase [Pseudobacteriovorax antillogorgiicola]TCS44256.1 ClpP class serine protease [Pseudobacteriovorax antillogorgiicola]SMF80780.1 serine protease, ClpP class [Pseudobacteriovorax antillogorgiicola]
MILKKAIESSYWAMREEGLSALIASVNGEGDFKALEKRLGEKPKYTYKATVRDGIGVIPIAGPLFKRANLLTEVCGATSYELVLRDLHGFLEDDSISSIVFNIDSQGGEVSGCQELSEHIYRARQKKPILAYIDGTGASAAYWIASAADKIFASKTAIIGSIGVQSVLSADRAEGEFRFISSQSPLKNVDPATEEGRSETQRLIDDLAGVFISSVARNRGVTDETVLADFGRGAVFISGNAKHRGMIDEIATFEDVMSEHKKEKEASKLGETRGVKAAKEASRSESTDHILARGVAQERARVTELFKTCRAHVDDQTLLAFIEGGKNAKDAAFDILASGSIAPKSPTPYKEDESLKGLSSVPIDSPSSNEDLVALARAGGWGENEL